MTLRTIHKHKNKYFLGEGHKLNETARQSTASRSLSVDPLPARAKVSSSEAQQQAAAAALARLEKTKDPAPYKKSAAIIRAQALKELELEKQSMPIEKTSFSDRHQQVSLPEQLAVNGVYYKCPLIGINF